MTYLVLTVFVIFLSLLIDDYKKKEMKLENVSVSKNSIVVSFLVALIIISLVVFAGVRTVYNDTETYIRLFNNVESFSELFNNYEFGDVLFFDLINSFFKNVLNVNYHYSFAFFSLIFVAPSVRFIHKYSRSFTLGMIVFMCFSPYLLSLAGMKQMAAIGILMYSYNRFINKQFARMIIAIILAQLTHTYSFFFLLFLLMNSQNVWKMHQLIVAGVIIVVGIMLNFFAPFIESMLELLNKSEELEDVFEGGMTLQRFAVGVLPLIISLIFKKQISKESSASETKVMNISFLTCYFTYFSLFMSPIYAGRVVYFFTIFVCVSYGNLLHIAIKDEHPSFRILCKFIFMLFFIVYITYDLYLNSYTFKDPFGFLF